MSDSLPEPLIVELGDRAYPIHLVEGLPDQALAESARRVRREGSARAEPAGAPVLVVTDSHVGPLYGRGVVGALAGAGFEPTVFELPAGEGSKHLASVGAAIDAALGARLGRRDLVVALGGGVVGDIAGFTASVLHRGVAFIQVPTTLLAQVDSAVGGKTGVNHATGKNLIGAFWQPGAVISSHAVLSTLPERERRCGLAEAIKHGFIADRELAAWCRARGPQLTELRLGETQRLVRRCCEIKAAVVAADEREGGRRAVLNFGHTLGHAYERLAGYGTLTHGEAISLGMVHAARLSERLGTAPTGTAAEIRASLEALGLPVDVTSAARPALEELVAAAANDKKADGDHVAFVLLAAVGQARIRSLTWDNIIGGLTTPAEREREVST